MDIWVGRLLAFLLTAVLGGGIFIGILRQAESSLLYPAPAATEPWGSLTVQRPDVALHGWLLRPDAVDAWVVFGGNALPLGPVGRAWTGCTGRALYLLPYRGYEGQAGHPREAVLVADGVALVRQAQGAHRHVGIIGVSLGTGIAIQVAVQTHPDRVLLVTPYDRLDLVGQEYLPQLPVRWLMRDVYDSASAAARLGKTPVAFLQADQDEVISAARTRALASALPNPPSPWWHVPTTHNGVWSQPALCEFVRQGA
jgi:pimeloyl-ACP methyl ester carboxylesterase